MTSPVLYIVPRHIPTLAEELRKSADRAVKRTIDNHIGLLMGPEISKILSAEEHNDARLEALSALNDAIHKAYPTDNF